MYEVIKDTDTSSELLGTFKNLDDAKALASEEVKNTNSENENEGINIYNELGIVLSYSDDDITTH